MLAAHTIVRGTLRKVGFSEAWNVFVQLGMTSEDNSKQIILKDKFLSYVDKLNNPSIKKKMEYLNLFSDENQNIHYNNPSEYLL